MHDGWLAALDVIGVLVALLVLAGVGLVVRRRAIARDGGTFELTYRMKTRRPGRGWVLGVGRYSGEQLQWFRFFSFSPRPRRVWQRDEVTFEERRAPEGAEEVTLYADHVVVRCSTSRGDAWFAMSESSLMGLQSWLESGPPGTNWDSRPLR